MKTLYVFLLCLYTSLTIAAQPLCQIKHFSVNNGLSQGVVVNIMQDKKGFLWFATWNGLNKFDGYTFKNYKAFPGDGCTLTTNRFSYITESKDGDIWCKSYDNRAYLFDIQTEKFIDILLPIESSLQQTNIVSNIYTLNKGITWITCEQGYAFRINEQTCKEGKDIILYSSFNQNLKGNKIFDIYEDSDGDEWIMTDKGVTIIGKKRPSSISRSDMREKHFAPFLAAIRQGALSVMVNSGVDNGIPFHANRELLTEWLKEDLNWDGMIVTDWADINNLCTRDHIAATKKEAVKIAINAGIDMSMVPYEVSFCDYLKELVQEGEVPMSRIDDAVARVLRLKYRLGLFENPYWDIKKYNKFGSEEFARVALQAAEESEVLLKNEGNILPLAKGTKILLAGPNANSMRCLNGGWSYSWQGHLADQCAGAYNTIYESLCNKYGKENIIYEPGVTYAPYKNDNWWEENQPEIEKSVAAASRADVIIACIGENSYCETPGNLTNLTMSENQRNLVKALAATGKPVILILNQGRPRIINDIVPLAKAVINVMLPGNYGGDALANLLAGDANFSGKMPFTYPKYINALANYDYKPCENMGQMGGNYNYDSVMDVQWEFGFGLSYTTYSYSNLKVDKTSFTADDVLTVSVDVTNTGKVAGKESVLLYSKDLVASSTPDNIRLRNFEKIELNPGETKTVTMQLKGSNLAFVGYDGKWRLEKGDFKLKCGNQWTDIQCSETKVWDTPNK